MKNDFDPLLKQFTPLFYERMHKRAHSPVIHEKRHIGEAVSNRERILSFKNTKNQVFQIVHINMQYFYPTFESNPFPKQKAFKKAVFTIKRVPLSIYQSKTKIFC